MKILNDISYKNIDECKLDLYLPENCSDKTPIYVTAHGGGLVSGDKRKDYHVKLAKSLTERGIALASINYRMYPNARYPEFLIDSADAVAFLMKNYQFDNFAFGGESAGGYITQMLYFNKEFLQNAGADISRIKAFVMDAGQPTAHFNVLKYEKGVDSRSVIIDETAPLYYLREKFKNPETEPYIAIFSSDNDMANRLEQNLVLKTAMLQFEFPKDKLLFKVFENYSHCGYINDGIYINTVTDFLKNAF